MAVHFQRCHQVLVFLFFLAFSSAGQGQTHYLFSVDQDRLTGVADFSSLNHVLTDADKVFVKSGHFYTVGADGRPATADDVRLRFFGISLSYGANLPTGVKAVQLARRLRRLGFNAVRLHHLDSYLSDDADAPAGILTTAAFPSFNSVALQRLRYLIAACKAEGIYIDLNLHVGYKFRPAVDGVPELGGKNASGADYAYLFEPQRLRLQEAYARQLIRALSLKNNPVLALVEINNEASLVWAWQKGELDRLSPASSAILRGLWQNWLLKKYGSVAHACAEWDSCNLPASGVTLVLSGEGEQLSPEHNWWQKIRRLADRVLVKTGWEARFERVGQLTASMSPAGLRVSAYLQFLAATDATYLHVMRNAVREEAGALVPVTGSQIGFGGLLNVDAQVEMDYVDQHFYVDHYDFPDKKWDRFNWRIQDSSLLRDQLDTLLQQTFYRDLKKPFVMSELNQPYPNRQGAELLPVVVSLASVQDWDGLFYYNYSNSENWPVAPNNFALAGDSAKLAECGISASVFRQFQIPALIPVRAIPVSSTVRVKVSGLQNEQLWPKFLYSAYGLMPQHAWLYKIGFVPDGTSEPDKPAALPGASQLLNSGVRELSISSDPHQLLMSGKYTRFFAGFSELNSANAIGSWSLKLLPPNRGFGVLEAISRDGLPIESSRRILLAWVSSSMGTQPESAPQRPKILQAAGDLDNWWVLEPDSALNRDGITAGPRDSQGPVWLERLPAHLSVPSSFNHIVVYPLGEQGQRLAALDTSAVHHTDIGFDIDLHTSASAFLNAPMAYSPWYELVFY